MLLVRMRVVARRPVIAWVWMRAWGRAGTRARTQVRVPGDTLLDAGGEARQTARMPRHVTLFTLALIVAIAIVLAARGPGVPEAAPRTAREDTTLVFTSLTAPARVVTDTYGFPHVRAANLHDLYVAWGYVTARDRLWQIAAMRRGARGSMWQWLGNDALQDDGGAQLFRFRERAAAIWVRDQKHPAVREALGAYAEGINAYMTLCRNGVRPWPPEFAKLGKTPEPWLPEDAYLILLAQGVVLDLALPEIPESRALRSMTPEAYQKRRAFEAEWTMPTIPDSAVRIPGATAGMTASPGPIQLAAAGADQAHGARAVTLTPDLSARARRALGRWLAPATDDPDMRASDVFAVGPGRSASGKPLLANDPHLPLTAPNTLHVIHLSIPGVLDAAGAAVPGMPMMVSGRNHDVAWGLTALSADVMDAYADTLSRDGKSVHWNGGWSALREEPFTMRYSILGLFEIPIPGKTRIYGPHGPVVLKDKKSNIAIGVRWAGSDTAITLGPLLGIPTVRSAGDLAARVRTLVTPCMNFVAADAAGHVVYQATGSVPRRGFDAGRGLVPGDGRHEWLGLIPPDEMPAWSVPPDGFVVNANNTPVGAAGLDPWPRYDWAHDRALRLTALLAATPKHDLASMGVIQNDVHSSDAERALPLLLKCVDSLSTRLTAREKEALARVRAWDREARRDRVGITIYQSWYGALQWRSKLGGLSGLNAAALDGRAAWALKRPRDGKPEPASRAALAALRIAIGRLTRRCGRDMSNWQWADVHVARFGHALDAKNRRFAPDIAFDGDRSTPSVGASRMPWSTAVRHAPVFRHLVDLSVTDSSLAVIALGNSGDPASGHAHDQLQRWADHAYVPLYLNWQRIEHAKESETRLEPAP